MGSTVKWSISVLAAAAAVMMIAVPAGAAGLTASTAQAPTVNNVQISGEEAAIGCMTTARCVAVGLGTHGGQVVSLYNGQQVGITTAMKGALTSVSCPGRAGCWAFGPRTGFLQVVKIGPTGKVTKVIKVQLPANVQMFEISCRSMTSCEFLGYLSSNPPVLYLGSWNGEKLRLHKFADYGDPGSYAAGFSCWRSTCVVVGIRTTEGCLCSSAVYAWIFTNGKPGARVNGGTEASFYADSCVSLTTCWIVGSQHLHNVVVELKDGVLGPFERGTDQMTTIECEHATCEAAGGNILQTITNGMVTGAPVTDDVLSYGSPAITNRGTGFAVIGPSIKRGYSEVVTG
jgi:hypothetical protein